MATTVKKERRRKTSWLSPMWRDIDSLRKQNESTEKEIESLRSETEILKRQNKALALIESSDLDALLREATIPAGNNPGDSEGQLDLDLLAGKLVALGCNAVDIPHLLDVLELTNEKNLEASASALYQSGDPLDNVGAGEQRVTLPTTASELGGHPKKILVVEPHATLRTMLAQRLRQDGHLTAAVGTAREALDVCQEQSPDLLVSAELLEETSALRLADQLHCPVMVLTARSGSEPVVTLLAAGADEVLRKPIGLEEMAVRARTLLRRSSSSGRQERICVGPLEVHILLRQVTLRDQPVELSPREFALLCALLMPPGMVRSRQELLRMAWPPFSGGPRSVDTQVLTLRRKLEQAGLGEGGGIEAMRQQGYRFSLDILAKKVDFPARSSQSSIILTAYSYHSQKCPP